MTNYNERLYEIIDKHRHDVDMDFSADIRHYKNTNETVDGITSLIKELVAEAKPEMPYEKLKSCPVCGEPQYNHSGDVHFDYGVNQYEENLLKALEEN